MNSASLVPSPQSRLRIAHSIPQLSLDEAGLAISLSEPRLHCHVLKINYGTRRGARTRNRRPPLSVAVPATDYAQKFTYTSIPLVQKLYPIILFLRYSRTKTCTLYIIASFVSLPWRHAIDTRYTCSASGGRGAPRGPSGWGTGT